MHNGQVTARILDGQKVLAEGVAGWYEQIDSGGFLSWYGRFEMDHLPPEMVNRDGPFEIEMSDGRSGQFLVRNVADATSSPVSVPIEIMGPLK